MSAGHDPAFEAAIDEVLEEDRAVLLSKNAQYGNSALGEVEVSRDGDATVFNFGEWQSEVASRQNPDDTVSFITTAPGVNGFEFVVGSGEKRTLVLRDAQHEYVFEEL